MKKVAGTLKLVYSQYRELQGFAQFGSDLDADTKSRLAQGERIVEILKAGPQQPKSRSENGKVSQFLYCNTPTGSPSKEHCP